MLDTVRITLDESLIRSVINSPFGINLGKPWIARNNGQSILDHYDGDWPTGPDSEARTGYFRTVISDIYGVYIPIYIYIIATQNPLQMSRVL